MSVLREMGTVELSCVCVCVRVCVCVYIYRYMRIYTEHMQSDNMLKMHTGWRRLIGCLKLQVIFCKRATNHRALLQKTTFKDTASYGSSPPCIRCTHVVCRRSCCSKIKHTYSYIYTHTNMYVRACVYACVCVCVCIYTHTCTHTHTRTHKYICIYIYI